MTSDIVACLYALHAFYDSVMDPAGAAQSDDLLAWLGTPSISRRREKSDIGSHDDQATGALVACLQQHVGLAERIQTEMQQLRVYGQTLEAALHQLCVAVFVLNAESKLTFLNAAAKTLIKDGTVLAISEQKLVADLAETNLELQSAITCVLEDRGRKPFDHVLVMSRQREALLAAMVRPLAMPTRDETGDDLQAAAVVLVGNPEGQIDGGVDAIARTYRLTKSEARLLSEIARGDPLARSAERLKIKIATARTHLKRIFYKIHTERQSELIRLITTFAPPARRPS